MTKISDVIMAGIEEVGGSWGWFLTLGMLLMVLGIVCVGARTATTVAVLAFGWILVFSALVWFRGRVSGTEPGRGLFIFAERDYPQFGRIRFIAPPDAGAEGIRILIASLFVVGGLFRTVAASLIQFPRWGWTAVSGAVAVILGFLLLGNWPVSSTFFIGMAIGIDLILDGSALVGFAAAIHGLHKAQTRAA
jgi:uncharacterized membrane protein HdeD (DUF308 family)